MLGQASFHCNSLLFNGLQMAVFAHVGDVGDVGVENQKGPGCADATGCRVLAWGRAGTGPGADVFGSGQGCPGMAPGDG